MKKIISKLAGMRMMGVALFAFGLLLPFPVRSEVTGGSVEISPFVGYNFFEPGQNLKDSLLYGGRITYNFWDHLGLEGTLKFANSSVNDTTLTGAVKGQYRAPTDKVDLFFYDLDAVYTFNPEDTLNFFVLAGLGGLNYNPSIASGDMSTFDFGLGMKYWFSRNFGLRLDIRDDMVTEIFHEGTIFENAYQNINGTVGLVIAFGGESEKEEAAEEVVYMADPEPKVMEKVKIIAAAPPVVEKTVVLVFEDLHFRYDKSELSDNAKSILKRSIQILRDNPKAHIRIAGYTSAAGTETYNQDLSERRARAVKNYLVQEGIVSQDRLTTIGYGEDRPALHEAAPKQHYSTAAKANMRVLFEVIVK